MYVFWQTKSPNIRSIKPGLGSSLGSPLKNNLCQTICPNIKQRYLLIPLSYVGHREIFIVAFLLHFSWFVWWEMAKNSRVFYTRPHTLSGCERHSARKRSLINEGNKILGSFLWYAYTTLAVPYKRHAFRVFCKLFCASSLRKFGTNLALHCLRDYFIFRLPKWHSRRAKM